MYFDGWHKGCWEAFSADRREKMNELKMDFCKKDIKSGDVCITRNGDMWNAHIGALNQSISVLTNTNTNRLFKYLGLDTWNDDLSDKSRDESFDIVLVYRPKYASQLGKLNLIVKEENLIYKRKEKVDRKDVTEFFKLFNTVAEYRQGMAFIYRDGEITIRLNDGEGHTTFNLNDVEKFEYFYLKLKRLNTQRMVGRLHHHIFKSN